MKICVRNINVNICIYVIIYAHMMSLLKLLPKFKNKKQLKYISPPIFERMPQTGSQM